MTARELDRLTGLKEGHSAILEKRTSQERIEARTLYLIAQVFGVDMTWLYAGRGRGPTADQVKLPVARARRHARRLAAARERATERPAAAAS